MTASRTCFDGPCSQSLNKELSCHIDGCKFSVIIFLSQFLKVMDHGQIGLHVPSPVEMVKEHLPDPVLMDHAPCH